MRHHEIARFHRPDSINDSPRNMSEPCHRPDSISPVDTFGRRGNNEQQSPLQSDTHSFAAVLYRDPLFGPYDSETTDTLSTGDPFGDTSTASSQQSHSTAAFCPHVATSHTVQTLQKNERTPRQSASGSSARTAFELRDTTSEEGMGYAIGSEDGTREAGDLGEGVSAPIDSSRTSPSSFESPLSAPVQLGILGRLPRYSASSKQHPETLGLLALQHQRTASTPEDFGRPRAAPAGGNRRSSLTFLSTRPYADDRRIRRSFSKRLQRTQGAISPDAWQALDAQRVTPSPLVGALPLQHLSNDGTTWTDGTPEETQDSTLRFSRRATALTDLSEGEALNIVSQQRRLSQSYNRASASLQPRLHPGQSRRESFASSRSHKSERPSPRRYSQRTSPDDPSLGARDRILWGSRKAIIPYRLLLPALLTLFFDFNALFVLGQLALYPDADQQGRQRAAWWIAFGIYAFSTGLQAIIFFHALARTIQIQMSPDGILALPAYLSFFHRLVLSARSKAMHAVVVEVDGLASPVQKLKETAWRWRQLYPYSLLDVPKLVIQGIIVVIYASWNGSATGASAERDPFFFDGSTASLTTYAFAVLSSGLAWITLVLLSVCSAALTVAFFDTWASSRKPLTGDDTAFDSTELGQSGLFEDLSSLYGVKGSKAARLEWQANTLDRIRLVLLGREYGELAFLEVDDGTRFVMEEPRQFTATPSPLPAHLNTSGGGANYNYRPRIPQGDDEEGNEDRRRLLPPFMAVPSSRPTPQSSDAGHEVGFDTSVVANSSRIPPSRPFQSEGLWLTDGLRPLAPADLAASCLTSATPSGEISPRTLSEGSHGDDGDLGVTRPTRRVSFEDEVEPRRQQQQQAAPSMCRLAGADVQDSAQVEISEDPSACVEGDDRTMRVDLDHVTQGGGSDEASNDAQGAPLADPTSSPPHIRGGRLSASNWSLSPGNLTLTSSPSRKASFYAPHDPLRRSLQAIMEESPVLVAEWVR